MRNDQLETMLNEWWQSTKTERWLLGNAKEVSQRIFGIAGFKSDNIKEFVIRHSLRLPGQLLIVVKPSEYTFHMCPRLLLKQLKKQLGGDNETP